MLEVIDLADYLESFKSKLQESYELQRFDLAFPSAENGYFDVYFSYKDWEF